MIARAETPDSGLPLFMKRLFVALGWMAVCFGAGWLAPSRLSAAELDRTFLFLIDTSLSMSRIQGGARQAVYDLIFSGVQGQIKKGDHYTIWTFNERVNTRAFIPMNWDPALNRALAAGASRFLSEQRLEKTTQISKVIAELIPTAKTTDRLTVFIISDGDDRMHGTAFDNEINFIYQRRGRELQRARKPFVTTLVFRGGNLASWQVTAGGEDIPLTEKDAATTNPAVALSTAPPATNAVPPPATNAVPLRMTQAAAPPATNKPPVMPQTNLLSAPPASVLSPLSTNKSTLPSAPPQPAPMASTATPPATVAVPVTSLTPASNKVSVPPLGSPSAILLTNPRSPAATSSVAKAPSAAPSSATETTAPKPPSSSTSPSTPARKPPVLETNPTTLIAPPATSLVSTQPAAVKQPAPVKEIANSVVPKTTLTSSPATPPPVTTESLVTTTSSRPRVSIERPGGASATAPKLTNDSTTAKPSPKLPAVASKPEPPANPPWPILAVGCGFLGVAFCLGFFLLRRRRAAAPTSLISQSLDRDNK
jgi:hypothetical protein